jgi:hypothetical protein
MRGCVAALFSILLVVPTIAQCNYSPSYSGAFRASYLDLAIDNNDLWAATSYGVQLFDRSVDPPVLVSAIAIPGITRIVRVANGTAYAGSGTRIYAIHKNGKSLTIASSIDAGANVNDLLATPLNLYAATANGLQQYDLPQFTRTSNTFQTSSANITSLAADTNLTRLYVADGDSSVEVFNITIPSSPLKSGTLDSLPRSLAVRTSGSRLYVSDGLSTDVFAVSNGNATKASTAGFGATILTTLTTDVVLATAGDRHFHAIDWSVGGSPVDLFVNDIPPSSGTVNRIGAIQIAGARLYVAAGDGGLLTYDISSFTSPYPVRSYATAPTTSAAWVDGKLYVSRAAGGLTEFTKNSTGALTLGRQWDARTHIVHDGNNGLLITSSGTTLYEWTLTSNTPVLVNSVTFPATITSAVMIGFNVYAVLSNRTLAAADLGAPTPTAQTVALANLSPSFIARSGNAIAIADIHDDGTTTAAFFPAHNFTSPPQTISVAGSASSGVALSGSTVALFTFRGINVIDFAANGSTSVIPQSNTALVRRIAFNGDGALFTLTDDALTMWDIATQKATRTLSLPISGSTLAVDTIAAIPTTSGVVGVAYAAPTSLPKLLATRSGNSYYRKAAASGDRLYLFDGRGVDVYETRFGFAPHFIGSARPGGISDFAITPTNLFTVTSGGAVASWSRDGNLLSQSTLNEGTDVVILGMNAAGGAPWVSFSRGCSTGSCEKKTAVLDPKTLIRATLLDGAAVEVAETNGRAFAVFDLPAEVRAYSLADAQHPSAIAAIASEGTRTPVSIAASDNVYVDGDKLYVYSQNLAKTGEQYDSYQADLTNTLQYTDQRVRADGGCVLVSARTFSPQFTSGATPESVPAVVKSIAVVPGRFYVLTDYSIEVWSSQPAPPTTKHRASR